MKKLDDSNNFEQGASEVKSLTKSLYTSFFLFIILIVIFVISHFSYKGSSWFDSLFIATMIYLCLIAFWVLIRFGFAKRTITRIQNYREKHINKQNKKHNINHNATSKVQLTKDWIGPIVSASIGVVLLIISAIFSYL
jgi:hypothetical protein